MLYASFFIYALLFLFQNINNNPKYFNIYKYIYPKKNNGNLVLSLLNFILSFSIASKNAVNTHLPISSLTIFATFETIFSRFCLTGALPISFTSLTIISLIFNTTPFIFCIKSYCILIISVFIPKFVVSSNTKPQTLNHFPIITGKSTQLKNIHINKKYVITFLMPFKYSSYIFFCKGFFYNFFYFFTAISQKFYFFLILSIPSFFLQLLFKACFKACLCCIEKQKNIFIFLFFSLCAFS